MNALTLSQVDMKRLERLAKEAGRTPRALFRFVLRDGFDETERTIKAVRARMTEGTRLEHGDAMKRLDEMLGTHAPSKQAA